MNKSLISFKNVTFFNLVRFDPAEFLFILLPRAISQESSTPTYKWTATSKFVLKK